MDRRSPFAIGVERAAAAVAIAIEKPRRRADPLSGYHHRITEPILGGIGLLILRAEVPAASTDLRGLAVSVERTAAAVAIAIAVPKGRASPASGYAPGVNAVFSVGAVSVIQARDALAPEVVIAKRTVGGDRTIVIDAALRRRHVAVPVFVGVYRQPEFVAGLSVVAMAVLGTLAVDVRCAATAVA